MWAARRWTITLSDFCSSYSRTSRSPARDVLRPPVEPGTCQSTRRSLFLPPNWYWRKLSSYYSDLWSLLLLGSYPNSHSKQCHCPLRGAGIALFEGPGPWTIPAIPLRWVQSSRLPWRTFHHCCCDFDCSDGWTPPFHCLAMILVSPPRET